MEDLRDIEDESYADSQDMVEYTSEEQEDEQEEVEHGTMDVDLEDLVEETNHPEESTDEVSNFRKKVLFFIFIDHFTI